MDKVSIVMPVYNTKPFLLRAIESIENQTYKNVELIIVDDASTDRSFEIYEAAAKKNDAIQIVRHTKNKGLSESRNDGIKVATGEWVMFLDSDDILYPNSVSLLIGQLEKTATCNIVLGSFNRNINGQVKCEYSQRLKSGLYSTECLAKMLFDVMPLNVLSCVGTKLYRNSFLKKYNVYFGVQYLYNEDISFIIDALMVTDYIEYVDEPVYEYIIRGAGSIQTSYRPNLLSYLFLSRIKLHHLFERYGCVEMQRDNMNRMWFSLMLLSLSQEYKYTKQISQTMSAVNSHKEIAVSIKDYHSTDKFEADIQQFVLENKVSNILIKLRNKEIIVGIKQLLKQIIKVK